MRSGAFAKISGYFVGSKTNSSSFSFAAVIPATSSHATCQKIKNGGQKKNQNYYVK